jgi:hypothetical protein
VTGRRDSPRSPARRRGRAVRQVSSAHECFWPGCLVRVPRSKLGCPPHWYGLPKPLRSAIWDHYQPGQDITTASDEYLAALAAVIAYANDHAGPGGPGAGMEET